MINRNLNFVNQYHYSFAADRPSEAVDQNARRARDADEYYRRNAFSDHLFRAEIQRAKDRRQYYRGQVDGRAADAARADVEHHIYAGRKDHARDAVFERSEDRLERTVFRQLFQNDGEYNHYDERRQSDGGGGDQSARHAGFHASDIRRHIYHYRSGRALAYRDHIGELFFADPAVRQYDLADQRDRAVRASERKQTDFKESRQKLEEDHFISSFSRCRLTR